MAVSVAGDRRDNVVWVVGVGGWVGECLLMLNVYVIVIVIVFVLVYGGGGFLLELCTNFTLVITSSLQGFELTAYVWLCLWYVFFTFDSVYVKHMCDTVKMTNWGESSWRVSVSVCMCVRTCQSYTCMPAAAWVCVRRSLSAGDLIMSVYKCVCVCVSPVPAPTLHASATDAHCLFRLQHDVW